MNLSLNGTFRVEELRLFGRWEGFGKETEQIGEEEIGVGLDYGEVMIAEMSVDRGSETVVDGGGGC